MYRFYTTTVSLKIYRRLARDGILWRTLFEALSGILIVFGVMMQSRNEKVKIFKIVPINFHPSLRRYIWKYVKLDLILTNVELQFRELGNFRITTHFLRCCFFKQRVLFRVVKTLIYDRNNKKDNFSKKKFKLIETDDI